MYWSGYDTLILVTGLMTAAIALIPIPTIPAKTRVLSVAIGAGLVLLSLILGNLSSFTYPGLVTIAPVLPVLVGGAIVKTALDKKKLLDAVTRGEDVVAVQHGQAGYAAAPRPAPALPAPAASTSTPLPPRPPAPAPPIAETADPRATAWAELFAPSTTGARLAEIAAAHPEFAAQIAVHPNAYPELVAWARATREDPR